MSTLRFTFSGATVRSALKRLLVAIPGERRTMLPALTHAQVIARKGAITMRGSDLDLSLSVGLSGSASEDGVMLVPARKLAKFVAAFPSDTPVTISYNGKATKVTCDRTSITFNATDPDEYPKLLDPKSPKRHRLDFTALGWVVGAASTDDNRPTITGVLVEGNTVVATDSYRLYMCETQTTVAQKMLIPHRAARILAAIGGVHNVSVGNDGRDLAFRDEGFSLMCRLISNEYPNYKGIVPTHTEPAIVFEDPEFADTIRRLNILIQGNPQLSHVLRFDEGSPVRAVAGTREEDELTASIKGTAKMPVGFNSRYLAEALKGAATDHLSGVNSLAPFAIRWSDDTYSHTRLLMPIRLPNT